VVQQRDPWSRSQGGSVLARCAVPRFCFYFILAAAPSRERPAPFQELEPLSSDTSRTSRTQGTPLGFEITQKRTPAEQHTPRSCTRRPAAVSFPNWAAALPPKFLLLARLVRLVSTPSRPALRLFTRSAHIGQPIARLSAELASRNPTFSFPGPGGWDTLPARPSTENPDSWI
jgi:hypothetical protein